MITFNIEITNPTGLHLRPGTRFVRLAKSYTCEIHVRKGEKTGNAKSISKLMRVGVSQGDVIELVCDGIDEQPAADAIREFLANLRE